MLLGNIRCYCGILSVIREHYVLLGNIRCYRGILGVIREY